MSFNEKFSSLRMIQQNSFHPVVLIVILISGLTITNQDNSKDVPVLHEIDFKLEAGRFYTVPVSHKGPRLLVGVNVEKKMDNINEDTVLECRAQSNERNYRDLFRTKLHLKLNEKDEDFVELQNKTFYSEYFTIIRQEVWTCATQLPSGERIGVIRVKNELVGTGIAEIMQVSFRDGVIVTPRLSTFNTRTAVIKEIKFLDPFNGMPVEYVGKVTFPEAASPSPKYKDTDFIGEVYRTVHEVGKMNENKDDGSFTEIVYNANYEMDGATKPIDGGEGGIKIGSSSGSVYGTASDIHNCRRFQGLNPLPFKFRTQGKIEIKLGTEKALDESNYFDEITPITHQVWYCEDQADQKKYFFRIINEFVTRRAHGKVVYWNDIVEIKEVRMPTGNRRALRIKAIKYFNPTLNPIKYVGRIKLQGQDDKDKELFKSYNSVLGVIRTREIEYILDKGRAYRTIVGNQGLNIKVNSKWVREIGKKTDMVTCQLIAQNNPSSYAQDYGTKIRVLVWIDNREESHAIPRSFQKKYWNVVKQELWTCSPQGKEFKFMRVVNKLEGLKAIYEIQYYEGVELHSRYIGNDKQSVTIIETKYVDPTTLEILKFEGELQLKDPPKGISTGCVVCSGPKIGAGDDEIVLEVKLDQTNYDPKKILGPVTFTGSSYSTYVSESKPFVTVRFKFNPTPSIGNEGDIVDCYNNEAFYEQFYPETEIYDSSKSEWIEVKDGSELAVKYLKLEEMVVRVCSQVSTDTLSLGSLSMENGYKFYMVQTKIKVPGDCKIFVVGYGVTVTSFSNQRKEAQLTQFFDFNNQRALKFEGKMRLRDTPNKYPNIISGTVDLENELNIMKRRSEFCGGGQELQYKLLYEKFYQLQIEGSESEILYLGTSSLSVAEIKEDNKVAQCQRVFTIPESEFRTEYRTKCYSSTDLKDSAEIFDEHFKMYGWEVWDCYFPTESEPRFKRIVNHFTLQTLPNEKKKIKEIQYYDGMSVEVGINVYGLTSWDFTEIKYTSPSQGKILSYPGKLELQTQDSIISDGKLVSKSESHTCLMDVYGHSVQYLLVNQIYRKFFSLNGLLMRIGSNYEKEFKEADKLRCQELKNVGHAYRPRVYFMSKYSGSTFFTQFKEMDLWDKHFKIYSSRLWECKPAELVKDNNFKLLRVETVLQILKMPASIYFYDGVTMDKHTTVGSFIEEIKYIDPSDNKLTKYEGFIRYEPSILNSVRFSTDTLSEREILYSLQTEVSHIKYFNQDGITLHIGSTPTDVLGKRSDTIVCRFSPYDRTNDKTFTNVLKKYYPQIISVNENPIGVKLSNSYDILQNFKLKRREYWECSLNSNIVFFKIINTLETSLPLSAVIYQDGITVWTRHTTDGKEVTVFRDISYVDQKVENKIYRFEGRVVNMKPIKRMNYAQLLSPTSLEVTQSPSAEQYVKQWKKKDWYKTFQIWENTAKYIEKEPLQNIIYMDHSPRKSVISFSNGHDIRVGLHWEYEIGSSNDKFGCEICDANNYKKSDLLTKLVISLQGDELETNEETIGEYFKVKNQEVSTCSNGDKSISFLRVVTELEGRVEVRNIEYYDGVEFFAAPLPFSFNGNTANIVEHKYLDPKTFKVIKFAGLLVKKSEEGWMYSIRVPVPVYHGERPSRGTTMRNMVDDIQA